MLTETQWIAKAARHQSWEASWRDELETLMERLRELTDIQAVQKVIDRADVIENRIEQLQRIMARHFERAPAELLPELISAFRRQMH
jgi:inhibitor of KinA sporulation pathway (predicted exonuclease)